MRRLELRSVLLRLIISFTSMHMRILVAIVIPALTLSAGVIAKLVLLLLLLLHVTLSTHLPTCLQVICLVMLI